MFPWVGHLFCSAINKTPSPGLLQVGEKNITEKILGI